MKNHVILVFLLVTAVRLCGADLAVNFFVHPPRGASPRFLIQEPDAVVFRVPTPVLPKPDTRVDERETVAACLVLEAANQGDLGQRAVMAVIKNRSRVKQESLYAVVTTPYQFSSLNEAVGDSEAMQRLIERAKYDRTWNHALSLVDSARHGKMSDPTGGATYFELRDRRPYWLSTVRLTAVIGAHAFYACRD